MRSSQCAALAFLAIGLALLFGFVQHVSAQTGTVAEPSSAMRAMSSQQQKGMLRLLLTDSSLQGSEVNRLLVTFRSAEVLSDIEGWIKLEDGGLEPGFVELVGLRGGAVVKFGSFNLPVGKYSALRLTLSRENAIEVEDVRGLWRLPLVIRDTEPDTVELSVGFTVFAAGVTTATLGFDAQGSISLDCPGRSEGSARPPSAGRSARNRDRSTASKGRGLCSYVLRPQMNVASVRAVDGIEPQIPDAAELDPDGDGISARLFSAVEEALAEGDPFRSIPVIVALNRPPDQQDIDQFNNLGGEIGPVYTAALYGFAGEIPAVQVPQLPPLYGGGGGGGDLVVVEQDVALETTLDTATRITRVRPHVWNSVAGSADTVIAVLDSGLDANHPDLAGRIDLSLDCTRFNQSAGQVQCQQTSANSDLLGHGTHVASIAAGSGAAAGTGGDSSGRITATHHGTFPGDRGRDVADWDLLHVDCDPGFNCPTDNLDMRIYETDANNQGDPALNIGKLEMIDDPRITWFLPSDFTDTSKPLTLQITITPEDPGTFVVAAGANCNSSDANCNLGGRRFTLLSTFPRSATTDNFNMFRGVAPLAHLVDLKIFDAARTGSVSWALAAMDWLVATDPNTGVRHNVQHNIRIANLSASMNREDCAFGLIRTAANNVVAAGTLLVASAGNGRGCASVCDPGRSVRVLTVGAMNDVGQLTFYTSRGHVGGPGPEQPSRRTRHIKPDVLAPGGSFLRPAHLKCGAAPDGVLSTDITMITAADSNDDDHTNDSLDQDNYANRHGTSMAAPHVAGLAALVAQRLAAQGRTWSFTEVDSALVKRLILLTASETNSDREQAGVEVTEFDPSIPGNVTRTFFHNPPLNRGGPVFEDFVGPIDEDAGHFGKDRDEGFGQINGDAAVDLAASFVRSQPTRTGLSIPMDHSVSGLKVFAAKVILDSDPPYAIDLLVPNALDADLYLYRHDSPAYLNGEPGLLQRSTTSSRGADEQITLTQRGSGEYIVEVRWVDGTGVTNLSFTGMQVFLP